MLTFLSGFIASVAHVVTGPDHMAAVMPLAIDSRKKSWMVGLSWGLGHTLGVMAIGLLFILFKEVLPIELISKQGDKIVGILLIGIGILAIIRIYFRHSHGNRAHPHVHHEPFLYSHIHKHRHDAVPTHEHTHTGAIRNNIMSALLIGIVHGIAGFSHLFALLPSLALPSMWSTVVYILAFALGTIFTMMLFAFAAGLVAYFSAERDHRIFLKWFSLFGGILAIAIGVVWLL